MPKEAETYRRRLEHNKAKVETLFGNSAAMLNVSQVAKLVSHSRDWVYDHYEELGFVDKETTVEKVTRYQSREPSRYERRKLKRRSA